MAGLFGSNSSFGMSSLFGNNSSSVLSDWAFIRSGTYKKLMKAYYGQDKTTKSATESAKTNKTKTTAERVQTEIETSATDLKKSTDALAAIGPVVYIFTPANIAPATTQMIVSERNILGNVDFSFAMLISLRNV